MMNNIKDLEEFRKQWKEEVSQKRGEKFDSPPKDEKEKKAIVNKYFGSDDQAGPSNKPPTPSAWDNADRARTEPNTLGSFLLAENLLKESNTGENSGETILFTIRGDGPPRKKTKVEHEIENKGMKKTSGTERFLDIFLADLDEINEIPFFDIELPRELAFKIFKHLDVSDLCSCARVSRAWKSLAEDDFLWSMICKKLGYEQDILTLEKTQWKEVVRDHLVNNRQLNNNWRNRTGAIYRMHYARGGILCACSSHDLKVVAGFTNGQVKFWDIEADEDCVFQPSNVALTLDDEGEATLSNYVTTVNMNSDITAAGYSQGYVDIWSNTKGTEPIHSFRGPGEVSALCLSQKEPLVVATFGNHVRVEHVQDAKFKRLESIDFPDKVSNTLLIPRWASTCKSDQLLVTSYLDCVKGHIPGDDQSGMATLHHVIGHFVSCLDYQDGNLAVGISSYDGPLSALNRINIQCIETCKEINILLGLTSRVSCINYRNAPQNMMAVGSTDRAVRVYDVRVCQPMLVLRGHNAAVTHVQLDSWKVVSGSSDGLVCVWDQRMATKLWDFHNRHPVGYLSFTEGYLVTANIPSNKFPVTEDQDDSLHHIRYRGSVQMYDFSVNQETRGVPSICLSSYDEPEGYNYNINLAMPYDTI